MSIFSSCGTPSRYHSLIADQDRRGHDVFLLPEHPAPEHPVPWSTTASGWRVFPAPPNPGGPPDWRERESRERRKRGGESEEERCRRWRSNPSGKCSQERLTRGTVTRTMRRAAKASGCARCGAGSVAPPPLSRSHTHSLTHSLCLSLTLSHTHSLSLPLWTDLLDSAAHLDALGHARIAVVLLRRRFPRRLPGGSNLRFTCLDVYRTPPDSDAWQYTSRGLGFAIWSSWCCSAAAFHVACFLALGLSE